MRNDVRLVRVDKWEAAPMLYAIQRGCLNSLVPALRYVTARTRQRHHSQPARRMHPSHKLRAMPPTGSRRNRCRRTPPGIDYLPRSRQEPIGVVLISKITQIVDLGFLSDGRKRISPQQVVAHLGQIR